MMAVCILDMLDKDEQKTLRGCLVGAKNVCRTRKKLENMQAELGFYARKAYRMSFVSFLELHDVLEPKLREEFKVGDCTRGGSPNGDIPTKLLLSAAIRFFAGASVYDIILMHGIGKSTVYDSVYGIVNVVNEDNSLLFNANGAPFPSHDEQREIAEGFRLKSAANFNKIVLTIDGMLIWTVEPSRLIVTISRWGSVCFIVKEKMSMAGFSWQASFVYSNYLAWMTSEVGLNLTGDDSDLIFPEYTIVGDNAFVENMTMATPVPGVHISDDDDAYNFYLSQVQITIERAFGILVHCWGILWQPMSMSTLKVPVIVICLMRPHNFCIDHDSRCTLSTIHAEKRQIGLHAHQMPSHPPAVSLNTAGSPQDLVDSGHHFRDEPGGMGSRQEVRDQETPMQKMMKQVTKLDLRWPYLE
ncbi:hypothetical protein ACHAW6_008724 [Cyclotella cf. meneghiniana]